MYPVSMSFFFVVLFLGINVGALIFGVEGNKKPLLGALICFLALLIHYWR